MADAGLPGRGGTGPTRHGLGTLLAVCRPECSENVRRRTQTCIVHGPRRPDPEQQPERMGRSTSRSLEAELAPTWPRAPPQGTGPLQDQAAHSISLGLGLKLGEPESGHGQGRLHGHSWGWETRGPSLGVGRRSRVLGPGCWPGVRQGWGWIPWRRVNMPAPARADFKPLLASLNEEPGGTRLFSLTPPALVTTRGTRGAQRPGRCGLCSGSSSPTVL